MGRAIWEKFSVFFFCVVVSWQVYCFRSPAYSGTPCDNYHIHWDREKGTYFYDHCLYAGDLFCDVVAPLHAQGPGAGGMKEWQVWKNSDFFPLWQCSIGDIVGQLQLPLEQATLIHLLHLLLVQRLFLCLPHVCQA